MLLSRTSTTSSRAGQKSGTPVMLAVSRRMWVSVPTSSQTHAAGDSSTKGPVATPITPRPSSECVTVLCPTLRSSTLETGLQNRPSPEVVVSRSGSRAPAANAAPPATPGSLPNPEATTPTSPANARCVAALMGPHARSGSSHQPPRRPAARAAPNRAASTTPNAPTSKSQRSVAAQPPPPAAHGSPATIPRSSSAGTPVTAASPSSATTTSAFALSSATAASATLARASITSPAMTSPAR